MEQKSLGRDFWNALKGFPRFALIWGVSLATAILSDYMIFSFLIVAIIAGVLVAQVFGLLTSVLVGLLAFFGLYASFRIIRGHAEMLGSAQQAAALHVQAGLVRQGYAPVENDRTPGT